MEDPTYNIYNMNSGIYRIKNLITNDCYYGSSKDIEKRWKIHKTKLKIGNHINIILTRAWAKYGESNFIFEIVELCDINRLKEVEQKYLNNKPKYNIGLSSSGGDNLTNNPKRISIIEKISIGLLKTYSKMTDEEKKEKHSKPMEKNPNWKGGSSYIKYYCECGQEKKEKAKTCSKCRIRNGDKNPFFNNKHSDETKKHLSELREGKYYGEQNIPISIDGVDYTSSGEASRNLNIPMVTIRWRVRSKNPKYSNYSYKEEVKISYTEEYQSERFSNPQIGKQHDHNKPFTIDGIEYRTLKEASKILNIHQSTIKGRLINKKFINYEYLIG